MSQPFYIVIPARYQSERLPGKPLADIHGLPMVVRTALSVADAGAQAVVIATDDQRIADAAQAHGVTCEMTRQDHPSGTDRLLEVVERQGWKEDAIVINVQGDEPLVPPAVVRQLADMMADRAAPAGTLCEPITAPADVFNPNIVKVVRDAQEHALYFSRAPIPYDRGGFGAERPAQLRADTYKRHIGIYAYTVQTLRWFVAAGPCALEQVESLEQLRLLAGGINLVVLDACEEVPGGVDTPEDLEHVREIVGARIR